MHRIFQSFIDGLANSTDAADLQNTLARAGAALDLNCFAYLALPYRREDKPHLISTYPTKWTDHYLRNCYEKVDPVIVGSLKNAEPFEWGIGLCRRPCLGRRTAFLTKQHNSEFVVASLFLCTIPAARSQR